MTPKLVSILIVEDDPGLREMLHDSLCTDYSILLATSASEGLRLAESHRPSLVLTDISMPGESGVELCNKIRSMKNLTDIPVLIMTGFDSEEYRVKSYDAGADDYILKPFSTRELKARIQSKLRRLAPQAPSGENLQYQELSIVPDSMSAQVAGVTVALSSIEFRILMRLIRTPEKVIERADLEKAAWANEQPQTRSLDVHISLLRKKIKACNVQLRTVYGHGYVIEKKTQA